MTLDLAMKDRSMPSNTVFSTVPSALQRDSVSYRDRIFHRQMQTKLQRICQTWVKSITEKMLQRCVGIRVHSLVLPGLPSSSTVHFFAPGEIYSIKHDITNVQCLMPGLLLAIRKVVRLKAWLHEFRKISPLYLSRAQWSWNTLYTYLGFTKPEIAHFMTDSTYLRVSEPGIAILGPLSPRQDLRL
ncbi:hypothetical protein PIB30_016928 [Stylosanthes scabra]|uniref:Dihydrodipicolinate reductase C-terminal domain-containing protein n=1 Tax=Stylosanthes scabra TaxID=79078 RepID=A0ABU6X6D3_9FABA|nr:hypothetical protein [Stylosanthes scabra]